MVRNVTSQFVIAYRGRRSHQALRADANLSAASLQKMARASQLAANQSIANMGRIGERFARLAQISAVIFGVALVKDFFTAGAGFQKSMSGVRAVSNSTRADFRKLEQQAKDLGATTVFTAGQSAEAMEKLALSGLNVNEIFTIMPAVLNLAAAGELDMADAATIAVGTLKGFGLEVDELASKIDVMAFTASNSNQTIRDIGVSFSFMGTVAAQAGLRFNEVNAVLAVLANRNIRAERSGTALRRIITTLIGDLEEGDKGLAGFGLQLTNTDGSLIGLADSIDKINNAGANMRDIMDEMRQRAGPAFLAMIQAGGEAVRTFEFALNRAGGTAKEVAEVRLNNLAGKITLLQSSWRNLAIEIFERVEPALSAFAVQARNAISAFSSNSDRMDRVASTIKMITKLLLKMLAALLLFRTINAFANAIDGLKNMNFVVGQLTRSWRGGIVVARRYSMTMTAMGAAGVLAVSRISFELAKMVLEITGINKHIIQMIERWKRTPDSMENFIYSLNLTVDSIDEIRENMDIPRGVNLDLSTKREVKSRLEQFKRAASQGDVSEMKDQVFLLSKLIPFLDDASGKYRSLWREGQKFASAGEDVRAIWAQAFKETTSYADAMDLANKRVDELIASNKLLTDEFERQEKELTKIKEAATKFLDSSLSEGLIIRPESLKNEQEAFKQFADDIGSDMRLLAAFSITASERILKFIETHKKMGEGIPDDIAEFVGILGLLATEYERVTARTDLLDDAWSNLQSSAAGVGLASKESLMEMSTSFADSVAEAERHGESFDFVVQSMASEIIAMIDAARKAGNEIPDNLAAVEGAARKFIGIEGLADKFKSEIEQMRDELGKFGEDWEKKWKTFGKSITRTVGDTAASVIVDQESLDKAVKASLKSLAKQAISMLIQWGLQKLIWDKVTKGSIISTHAANMAGYMGEVYLSSFASAASNPIWGWAAAPGIASGNVGIASGFAATAMAAGSALALAGLATPLADGGIVTRRIDNATIGEAGPEAVIPLSGERAKRAVRELGIGGDGGTINVNMTFTGDNWSEDGVSETLTRRVAESIDELIGMNKLLSFRRSSI